VAPASPQSPAGPHSEAVTPKPFCLETPASSSPLVLDSPPGRHASPLELRGAAAPRPGLLFGAAREGAWPFPLAAMSSPGYGGSAIGSVGTPHF